MALVTVMAIITFNRKGIIIMQKSAKDQLASGKITVARMSKGVTRTKQVTVPEWLFDLASLKDSWIFPNVIELHGAKHLQAISNAMFTGLLIAFRAKHRKG